MKLTRRGAVLGAAGLAGLAAAEFAGVAEAAPFAWQARHGLTGPQYQAVFNQLTAQGYRPIHVDGYAVAGIPRFAAIFAKTGGGAWLARHNMTAAQYQQTFNNATTQGYRLTKISGYAAGNMPLYAAIFEKRAGGAWLAKHGMTGAQYQQNFNTATGQGYRLSQVSGYVVGGVPYYAAIFEQPANVAWMARHGMDAGEYQQAFDQAGADGFRLRQVSGYSGGGAPNFAAVWDKSPSGPWLARHNLTSAAYQQTFNEMTAQGYRPVDVSGYDIGGQAHYAAIWVKD